MGLEVMLFGGGGISRARCYSPLDAVLVWVCGWFDFLSIEKQTIKNELDFLKSPP
jgi:hypothetical protein